MLSYISVFGHEIPVYSLAAMTGCFVAILYFKTGARRRFCDSRDTELVFIQAGIGAIVGAKLLSLLTQLPNFIEDFSVLISAPALFAEKYFFSGFVFYGGLYGALISAWLYTKRHHISFCNMAACLSPTLPLIHGFGRIGCFLVGCCYGKSVNNGLGFIYHNSIIAPNDIPLIPIQLFEACAEFVLFACMLLILRKGKCMGPFALSVFLMGYGVVRFILEFFRGDTYRGFIGLFSISQWISIPTVILGIVLFVKSFRAYVFR